jgi:DNA/RNA-binding domain of Phe-tRNA-synthetase-like protein
LEIKITAEVSELISGFKVGFIQYKDIIVEESPQMLKGRLQLFQESIYFELEDKKITDYPGIGEWRQIFKITGKDPNRYRHSAEALYRRIHKQNYLSPINSAIDLNNFYSIKYEIPIGIYDSGKLKGNISIRMGKEGEVYVGLNGRSNSLNQLILSADEEGPFGSTFVDSKKTAVTNSTKEAVQIVYLQPSINIRNAEKMVSSLANMFTQIHGGEGTWAIIN